MKRSKATLSSRNDLPKLRAQRPPVELRFPATEAWQNIVRDFQLTPAQADMLKFTVEDARCDLRIPAQATYADVRARQDFPRRWPYSCVVHVVAVPLQPWFR
jgi:hypothetical protein